MAQRAKMSDVDSQVETLNRMMGVRSGEIGAYRLDGAYNGYTLHQIINEHGGCTSVTYGYESLTRVSQFLRGLIMGIRIGQGMETAR